MTQEFDVVFSEINESFDCTFESGDETFVMEMGSEFRPDQYEGYTEITPSEQTQVLHTAEKYVKDDIVVNPVPGGYIKPEGTKEIDANGTYDIKRYESVDVDVPIPPGYIIPSGTLEITENDDYDITQYAGVSVDVPIPPGYIIPSGTKEIIENGTGIDVTEYADVDVAIPDPPLQDKTVTPTKQQQVVEADSGYYGLDEVTINAIPNQYIVPEGTKQITANGNDIDVTEYAEVDVNVPAPAPVLQDKTVTPTKQQQTVHADQGYDGLDDVTVNAIPSQYIVPSGTKSITSNGQGIDVKEYEYANVAVPAPAPTLQTKSVTPTESAQVVTADSGYDGLDEVDVAAISSSYVGSGITRRSSSDLTASGATVSVPAGYYQNAASKSVASGTAGTPTASKGSVSNHAVTVTPSVTNQAGYISGGTKTGTGVSVSASELVSGNLPITSNGNNIDVTNYETVSVNVPGGGTSKNVQVAQSTTRATSSSYTEVISLTCEKSGTYDVYWSTHRTSTSGTWGSQLYLDNTAYGSAQTGSWSYHIQNIHLTGVQIDAGEEVAVRVRSRGSNYYGYVGTLTIIEA